MRCPSCGQKDSRVIDSRPCADCAQIRRRRFCPQCNYRFTTYETFEEVPIVVIKKDGRREEFNRQKMIDGLVKACEKRKIPLEKMEALVDGMVSEIRDRKQSEATVEEIGEMILQRLLDLDKIAYVRFVSVYRNFEAPEDFLREVEHLFEGKVRREAVTLKVKYVRDVDLPLPSYAHEGDSGVDLYNAGDGVSIAPGDRVKIPTGIAVSVPIGYELQIRPRSGLAIEHGLTVINSPGTIDSGYRGELAVVLINTDKDVPARLKKGERVAQAVLTRCERIHWEKVEELDESARGEGGFGSTGGDGSDDV